MTIYVASASAALSPDEFAYWQDRAAWLDPRAYQMYLGTSVNVTVPAGGKWYAMDQYYGDTVGSGPTFQRVKDARSDLLPLPAGFNVTTDGSHSGCWYICQPELVNALRTDACGTTSGSSTITDASITSNDIGKPVTGTGIPTGSYVGLVTAGTSFTLVDATWTAVNATATGSPSLTIGDTRYQSDPKGLYYARQALIPTLALAKLQASISPGSAITTTAAASFSTGTGTLLLAMVTQVWCDGGAWITLTTTNSGQPLNVQDEVGTDNRSCAFARSTFIPIRVKNSPADGGACQGFSLHAGNLSGNTSDTTTDTGYGGIRYAQLPPTW